MISSALTAWAELFYKSKKVQQGDIVFIYRSAGSTRPPGPPAIPARRYSIPELSVSKIHIDIGRVVDILDDGRITIRFKSYMSIVSFIKADIGLRSL